MKPWILSSALFLTACVTNSRAYDPAQPGLAWDAECIPDSIQGMNSWVILTCTMTNRSKETLIFRAIDRVTSENEAWRLPVPEELAELKRTLHHRSSGPAVPLFLNGGDRLEGFIAQVLVVSGIWLTRSMKDPIQLPEKTEKALSVAPGRSVRQAFVLYKDSLQTPAYVVLGTADGQFEKEVRFTPPARQRVPL